MNLMTIGKHLTIPDHLAKYVDDTALNLSHFLQQKLEERIIAEGKAEQYLKDIKKK